MKYAKWTWTLATCFLLLGPSRASATYVVIENISQAAPNWGDCNCIQASGWLARVFIDLIVEDNGSTYTLNIVPSDYYPRSQVNNGGGNYFLLGITKKNPVGPGESYTSKRIMGLPESGFRFTSANGSADIGIYYCEAAQDSCGGYSTGLTNVWPNGIFIVPGLSGSDSFDFQVQGRAAGDLVYSSVVRVTFYPGNPPPHGGQH